MNKSIYILFTALVLSSSLAGQEKRGYQWIMGGNSVGSGVRMNFNSTQVSIFYEQTGIKMEGSNTSMCDEEGNLLFYSNGCVIVNAMGEVMQNGDSINPGIIQNFYCPFGGSPIGQGVVAIPAPESESLYYVFNLDFDFSYLEDTSFLGVAPQRLYYQVI
ncbi:MAG: hypothetical protein HUU01_14545, partial [Saprospiraceae bacterium]|nr:hypothetical protein [Saprospiraceae bacterium]